MESWARDRTERRVDLPGIGVVRTWIELTDVSLPLVSFRHSFVFDPHGTTLTSNSTLRSRSRGEVTDSLTAAGFAVNEVREAPDRPGLELVFVATTPQ